MARNPDMRWVTCISCGLVVMGYNPGALLANHRRLVAGCRR